ncbi:MAG: MGMT family protein [Methanobacteriaceae archaeon]|nr:MGMT family protein [Methanobacteriaceae archaeon]
MDRDYVKIINNTPFGHIVILWGMEDYSTIIRNVFIPKPDMSAEDQVLEIYPDFHEFSCPEIDELANSIYKFLKGEDIVFSLDMLNLNNCSLFQKSVLQALNNIPKGKVSSYHLLAKYLGNEKGARAVGNVLSSNPFPIIIPCHRVIRSDGTLGGFQGGLDMKKALLENEGINFDNKGKLIFDCFHYQENNNAQKTF